VCSAPAVHCTNIEARKEPFILPVSIHTTSHYYNAASKDKLQSIKECRNQVCRKKELVSSRALTKRK